MSLLTQFLNSKIRLYEESEITNERALQKTAEENALKLFYTASQSVPAYKDFLKKRKISPEKIKTISDFQKIDPVTKENYINKYDLKLRCWSGKIENNHMISSSSGTTGSPLFWPRRLNSEIEGALLHEFLLEKVIQVKGKTLFINGFALGNWIAGTFTQASTYLLALKGQQITLATPGYSIEDLLSVLKHIAKDFRTVIIAGHVPFLKEVAEEMVIQGVSLRKCDVTLLGAGQGITENWRDFVNSKASEVARSSGVINLYGSADAALMGFEDKTTIAIRRHVTKFQKSNISIFRDERVPSLYVYDPRMTYIESVEGELAITKDYGCPLVRYNIHDTGGVYSYSQMNTLYYENTKQNIQSYSHLPFVYLFGREKFMVKIFGANIYSEHVQHALSHEHLQQHLTGNFKMEIEFTEQQDPLLLLRAELKNEIAVSEEIEKMTTSVFIREVSLINSEYRFLLKTLKTKVHPKVILHEYGHEKHFPKNKISKNA